MQKSNAEFRHEALNRLGGNWTDPVIITLIYIVLCASVGTITTWLPFGSLLSILVTGPLYYGLTLYFLKFYRSQKPYTSDIFEGFKDFNRIMPTMLLYYIYIFLWSLLLIIPGIIKYYSYAMTPYLLVDDSSIKNNAAIEKSIAMMDGNKMRLFTLHLSFIGWGILASFTCGIGFLWLIPYMQQSEAAFYEDLKGQQQEFNTNSDSIAPAKQVIDFDNIQKRTH